MLNAGVIQPSSSFWGTPVVTSYVTKKDSTKQFCIDYHQLNSVMVNNAYPIPRVDTTLDSLEEGLNGFLVLIGI